MSKIPEIPMVLRFSTDQKFLVCFDQEGREVVRIPFIEATPTAFRFDEQGNLVPATATSGSDTTITDTDQRTEQAWLEAGIPSPAELSQATDWNAYFPDPPATRLEALPERSMGHLWGEDTHGRYCKACGRRWAEVIGVTRDDLTQPHFAHIGGVVEKEVEQAEAERDWLMQTIRDAASAGSADSE